MLNLKKVELNAINEKLLQFLKGEESEFKKECKAIIEYKEIIFYVFSWLKETYCNAQVHIIKKQTNFGHIADLKMKKH